MVARVRKSIAAVTAAGSRGQFYGWGKAMAKEMGLSGELRPHAKTSLEVFLLALRKIQSAENESLYPAKIRRSEEGIEPARTHQITREIENPHRCQCRDQGQLRDCGIAHPNLR
jgi:hypothetical protein